ncbi:UNVERIFIED_CONTAM: hypothetical protein RMT77_014505 [Armadillidium vulgare]
MRRNVQNKLLQITIFLIIVYFCFKKGSQRKSYKIFIPNVDPKVVWEFLADYSNVAKLNIRIVKWQLVNEDKIVKRKSHFPVWIYNVVSYETMIGQFLFGLNENHATIEVEEVDLATSHFRITNMFKTYSFRNLIKINNTSRMDFRKSTNDGKIGTIFEEKIVMNCPLLFTFICNYETDRNREDFYRNLLLVFQ